MDIALDSLKTILSWASVLAFVVLCAVLVYKWLQSKQLPILLIVTNLLGLLPIVFAPLVFFGSIFIFDNPGNYALALLLFLAVNSYSVVLIFMMVLSTKVYLKTHSQIKAMIPLIPALIVYGFILYFFVVIGT